MTVTAAGLGVYNGPDNYGQHYGARAVFINRAPLSTDTLEAGVLWIDLTNKAIYINITAADNGDSTDSPVWYKWAGSAYTVLA